MSLSTSGLYFFDQVKNNRKKKRYRKPAELLPFPLRLTGLSGAVRVEAYLKQQQKAPTADSTINKESTQVNINEQQKENREGLEFPSNQEVSENINQSNKDTKNQEGESKKKSRRTFNLPNIGLTGFHTPPAIRSLEQIEDDDDEDTQRFLFEENKFAAPNFLAQRGLLLEYIHEKLIEELEEINSFQSQIRTPLFRTRPTSGKSTFSHLAELEEEILSDSFLIQGYAPILIPLPEDLHKKLLQNYDQLSANTVYVKRDWQTRGYREQAVIRARLGMPSDSRIQASESHKDKNADHRQQNNSSQDILKVENVKSTAKDKKRSSSIVPDKMNKKEDSEFGIVNATTPQQLDSNNSTPAPWSGLEILKSRRESRASSSTALSKVKTRIEKYKLYPDKGKSLQLHVQYFF